VGVDVQTLVGINSAVTDLRMREKTRFVWIFININVKKTGIISQITSLKLQKNHFNAQRLRIFEYTT